MTAPLDDRLRDLADRLDNSDLEELSESEMEDLKAECREALDALQPLADFWASVPDETKQRLRERVDMHLEQGHYDAELRTPDGGVFKVGPAHVWGNSLTPKQNVDLPIGRVPEHLWDSGLGECELTIYSSEGFPLLSGPLRDDGNRQDGLNQICVAVEYTEQT